MTAVDVPAAVLKPGLTLASNDFELFGLAPQMKQDAAAIHARWQDLQREAHPDKFAGEGAVAQRLAMQWSVRINEAHQRLKDPLKRAAYLCELRGAPVNAENNTAMPADFLMQQIQWREMLDDATDLSDANKIDDMLKQEKNNLLLKCEQYLDVEANFQAAVGQVRALMFIERFAKDVNLRIDALESGGT